jgi:hypothetical protein
MTDEQLSGRGIPVPKEHLLKVLVADCADRLDLAAAGGRAESQAAGNSTTVTKKCGEKTSRKNITGSSRISYSDGGKYLLRCLVLDYLVAPQYEGSRIRDILQYQHFRLASSPAVPF